MSSVIISVVCVCVGGGGLQRNVLVLITDGNGLLQLPDKDYFFL